MLISPTTQATLEALNNLPYQTLLADPGIASMQLTEADLRILLLLTLFSVTPEIVLFAATDSHCVARFIAPDQVVARINPLHAQQRPIMAKPAIREFLQKGREIALSIRGAAMMFDISMVPSGISNQRAIFKALYPQISQYFGQGFLHHQIYHALPPVLHITMKTYLAYFTQCRNTVNARPTVPDKPARNSLIPPHQPNSPIISDW